MAELRKICGTKKISDQKYRNHFYLTEPKIVWCEAAEPLKFSKVPILFESVIYRLMEEQLIIFYNKEKFYYFD